MATYPLKNLGFGGNVYQIQSGDSYRVTLRAVFNNTSVAISSKTVKEILETYASSINWQVTGIYKLGPGGGSYDPSQTMIDDLVGMKFYQAEYEFRGSDTTKRGNFITWSPEDAQASVVMFGIIDYDTSVITGLVSVSVDNEQNTVGNMMLSDFGGGGGGGSSLRTLSIHKNGGEVSLDNLMQSDNVELWDISTSTPVTLDATGLANIIKTSPVIIKDNAFYANISSFNTSTKELSLMYASSTQVYLLTLTNQWSTNWQVTGNKRLVTQ